MGTASDLGPMSNVKASDFAAMAMAAEPSSNTQNMEYEGLLEMHECRELAANPAPTTPEVDLEAARAPAEETAPKEPRAPLTEEEMRAKTQRVTPMDNIRALALCLLILQNAAIQAVSTHPQAAQLREIAPRMLAFVNIFVGMTRLFAVPLLFFVPGFESQFAMAVHDRSPIRFLIRKTWRSALTIGLFQGTAYLSKLVHPLLHGVDGPTAYVVAILALDYVYANYPQIMPPFLDVRRRPVLTLIPAGMQSLPEEGIDVMYGVWVGYTLMVVPDALIAAFWSIRPLATTWVKFSPHAHIQVYVQLLFIVENSVSLFDNLFVRWVYLALGTIYCAHYFGVLGVMLGGAMKRGWNALRRCRNNPVEAQEGGISL